MRHSEAMMAPMLARVQAVTMAAQGLPVGERVGMLAAQGLPVGERVEMLAAQGLPVGERVEMLAAKGLPVGVQAVTAAAKGLLLALLVAMLFCGAGSAAAQTLKIGNNVKTVKVGEGAAVSVTKDQTVQAPARTKVRIKATSPEPGLVPRLKLTKATTSSGGQGHGGTSGQGGEGGQGQGVDGGQSGGGEPVQGGGGGQGGEPGPVPENTSPTITVTPSADLSNYSVGVPYQFTTQITNPSGLAFSISWSVAKQSDNQDGSFVSTNDALISQFGVFYATFPGTYKIIATADNDLGISGSFYIVVENAPSSAGTDVDPGITPGGIAVTNTMTITTGNNGASVRPGEKMILIATDKVGNVLHPTWTLLNNSSTINSSRIDSDTGIFTAGSQEENCLVFASLQGYDRATFIVTVSADAPEFTPVDLIIIPDPPVGTILSINSTYPLQAVIYPDNASIKSVSWAVSGSDILGYPLAEIDPYTGVLKTFNSHGDITVTATALDGSGEFFPMTLSIE